MVVSRVQEDDVVQLRDLIINTCIASFNNYYPKDWIDYTIKRQTLERLKFKVKNMHFYVARKNKDIIGCGAIDFNEATKEAWILSFFVDIEFQNNGIGKLILNTLEKYEYYTNARKVFVASSIPGLPFYIRNGFRHKDNKMNFDNGEFLLEKIK